MSAQAGDQILSSSDYSVHDLSQSGSRDRESLLSVSVNEESVLVNKALLSRIELLESEKRILETLLKDKRVLFRVELLSYNDTLILLYTGFSSYVFLNFPGRGVNNPHYWGTKSKSAGRGMKLNPLNQLFLTLVKLRLDLREQDLAVRFGISSAIVSTYFITWVCCLYNHFKEIDWMEHYRMPSRRNTLIRTPLLMAVRFLSKNLLICIYNHLLGVIINTITQQSFCLSKWCSTVCVSTLCRVSFRCSTYKKLDLSRN